MALDVSQITIDERLLDIKAARNDILCVLQRELVRILKRELLLEKRLLIIYSYHRQHKKHKSHDSNKQAAARLTRKHNDYPQQRQRVFPEIQPIHPTKLPLREKGNPRKLILPHKRT